MIRLATTADANACLAIYAPVVAETAISFEIEVHAFAGVALPNEASVGLHEALGFLPIGVYQNVGFKLGRWIDVGWWQLQLQDLPGEPAPPLETLTVYRR